MVRAGNRRFQRIPLAFLLAMFLDFIIKARYAILLPLLEFNVTDYEEKSTVMVMIDWYSVLVFS